MGDGKDLLWCEGDHQTLLSFGLCKVNASVRKKKRSEDGYLERVLGSLGGTNAEDRVVMESCPGKVGHQG